MLSDTQAVISALPDSDVKDELHDESNVTKEDEINEELENMHRISRTTKTKKIKKGTRKIIFRCKL